MAANEASSIPPLSQVPVTIQTDDELSQNGSAPDTDDLAQMTFRQAAPLWLESRRPYISENTVREYQVNIRMLTVTFGEVRLSEVTADQIRSYQKMRQTECGPFGINHECGILQQMLKRIGRWPRIAPNYQPLPLPKETPGPRPGRRGTRTTAPEETESIP